MYVQQNLSILFYRKTKKQTSDGTIPLYCRITIDTLDDEFSTGIKVLHDDWDNELKIVLPTDPKHKTKNKAISAIRTDISRSFDLVKAQHEMATPLLVKHAYQAPAKAERLKTERVANARFSLDLDELITKYVIHQHGHKKYLQRNRYHTPERLALYEEQQAQYLETVKDMVKLYQPVFADQQRVKTLVLTINEYLLNFLVLCIADERAFTTLQKLIGFKRIYTDFLLYRFKKEDLPLDQLGYTFAQDLYKYILLQRQSNGNTAGKRVQYLKEMIDRAVDTLHWISHNPLNGFKSSYKKPKREWPSLDEMRKIIAHPFKTAIEREMRDVIVFCAFTGLAFEEAYSLRECDIVLEQDGKLWINKDRLKTGNNEPVPLLPICEQLLDRYKGHPVCGRTGQLLPVRTNQTINKFLKVVSSLVNVPTLNNHHQLRYFFANEVTYDNGVELKTISAMLSHESIRTTEIYVRPNRKRIGKSMQQVEDILFDENGQLRPAAPVQPRRKKTPAMAPEGTGNPQQAKVVAMKAR